MKATLNDLLNYDYTITDFTSARINEKHSSYNDYSMKGRYKNLLLYLINGTMDYFSPNGEKIFSVAAGDILFIADKSNYISATTKNAAMSGIVVCFNLKNCTNELIEITNSFCLFAGDHEKILHKKFNTLSAKILENQCLLSVKSTFFDLLYSLLTNKKISQAQAKELLPALEFIELHPEKSVSIKELAKMCQMSESSFSHKFTKYTNGMTPIRFRNRIRIMKAEEMANDTNLSVEEIAEMLGFYDASYLCRYYKQCTGKTLKTDKN